MALQSRDGKLLINSVDKIKECGGPECCIVPGPQPCNSTCPACEKNTKPKMVRLTIEGVTERAGATGQLYIPGPMTEACTAELGDVVTDVFACLGLNRTFDMGCNGFKDPANPCNFIVCGKLEPGPCTSGPVALHSIVTTYEYTVGPPARNFRVAIARAGECSAPPSGETGNSAIFILYQNDYETDCSGLKTLTQYLVESASNPCDFSGATVTLEIIEYAFILPETLYLTINGTCLEDDVVTEIPLTLDVDTYKGVITCGEQTLNVWYSCTDLSASPCLDPNDPTAQATWRLQLFDGVNPDDFERTCFLDISEASESQDPFLWEKTANPSGAYDCCLCTTETLTFTVSQ